MKTVIYIGKPTHLRRVMDGVPHADDFMYTACGLSARVLDAGYDPRDVDCLRCRKTKEWHYRMTGEKK